MRSRAFAAAISRRHGPAAGRWPRAALVLLQARTRPVQRAAPTARHQHWHAAPRIHLHLQHGPVDARRSFVTMRVQQQRAREAVSRMALRTVIARSGAPTEHAIAPAPPVPFTTVNQVVMVTRRPVTHDTAVASPSRHARMEAPPASSSPSASPAPVTLPSRELERVTDHVLRSLDRRLSSWRDRRGKS